MISCILLSAGESRRFGSPKALAPIENTPAIARVQKMLLDSQVDEIIIVLGAQEQEIKPVLLNHKKVKVVYNKDYNLGQTSSFQAGLAAADPSNEAFLLLPVDVPNVQSASINRLVEFFLQNHPLILIPTFEGYKGHPPLFNSNLKDEFTGLSTALGLNEIARRHADEVVLLEMDDKGVCQTFNTLEDLKEIS